MFKSNIPTKHQLETMLSSADAAIVHRKLKSKKQKVAGVKDIDLSLKFVVEHLAAGLCCKEPCALTGVQMVDSSSIKTDLTPTLDRIDNSLGYIDGNVNVISSKANSVKSAFEDSKESRVKVDLETKDILRKMFIKASHCNMQIENPTALPEEIKEIFEIKEEEDEIFYGDGHNTDVKVALSYAAFACEIGDLNKKLNIPFARYKIAFNAKRCFITGNILEDDKVPMITDNSEDEVNANIIRFTTPALKEIVTNLMDETGLSLNKIVNNLIKKV